VIALGVKLARQRGEDHLIRLQPKELSEFRPEHLKAAYDAYSSDSESEESSEDDANDQVQKAADEDDWNNVEDDRQTKRTKLRKQ
jgi:hypothetical protein